MGSVVIIGAGPAGCVAATVLARAGVDVAIVEQHRFPRDKVCGECLSALAIDTLEKLELASPLAQLHPAMLRETTINTVEGARFRMLLPRPMWGISRRMLDESLLRQAMNAGASVLQPARCEGLDSGSVRVRDLQTNQVRTIDAPWVIVADGKSVQSLSPAAPTADFGIKAHFENVDRPAHSIELFGLRGAYGGLAAIERGRWNGAFSVPAGRLRDVGGNIGELFARMRNENSALDRSLEKARQVTDWLAAPLPRFGVRRRWPSGVIPVGNAAAAIEPIGGEGMGLAIASGELAARHILRHGASRSPAAGLNELFREYEKLWRVRRASCRLAAMVVSRPWASRVLLPLLKVVPVTRGISMSLLGKGYLKPSMSDMV